MKGALRAIAAIGILWMAALTFERTIIPHVMLDAILPERILRQTTPEERQEITERLKKHQAAGILSWLGAAGITLLSLYALTKTKTRSEK
jgi:hypothetical protein